MTDKKIDYKSLPVEVLGLAHHCNCLRNILPRDHYDLLELLTKVVNDHFDYLNPVVVIDYGTYVNDILNLFADHIKEVVNPQNITFIIHNRHILCQSLLWLQHNRDRLISEYQAKLIETSDHDEWEPGGTLGNSAEHAVVVSDVDEKAIDDSLGLEEVSIRLSKELLYDLDLLAQFGGLNHQALIRNILTKTVEEYKNKIL